MSIGSLLLAFGFITTEQLEQAVTYQHEHANMMLGEIVVAMGFAAQTAVLTCLAKQAQMRHDAV
jgi:hypothetical protein